MGIVLFDQLGLLFTIKQLLIFFFTKDPIRMPSEADGNVCSPSHPASFNEQASLSSQQPEAMVNALKVTCLAVLGTYAKSPTCMFCNHP